MDSILPAIDATWKESKEAVVLQGDVVGMTEDPCDMDALEVDVALDSDASHELGHTDSNLFPDGCHVLDEDPEMSKECKPGTGTTDPDEASKATESSEADEIMSVRKECLLEVGGGNLATEAVDNVDTAQIPRQRSEWLADWLTGAAEWEECGWSRAMGMHASLSLQRSASEQDVPFTFSRTGHEIDPSARRRLRERFLSAKWNKQLSE